jgi:PhnB protein
MSVRLNPYINFRDNARQAMEFYHSVFGGELTTNTFAELQGSEDPAEQDKLMHAMIVTDNGLVIMGSDTPNGMPYSPPAGIAVSLSGDEEGTLRGYWDKLSAGGAVVMALEQAPWGDTFGMCVDQFGITWMVNIMGATG